MGIPVASSLRRFGDFFTSVACSSRSHSRSELVALEVDDLNFEPEGVGLTIRRSKTDREGAGATVAVPFGEEEATCPVRALRRWLEATAIGEGRGFLRTRTAEE